MEFATSLSTGKTYEAVKVSYAQAKALKLVCPVCKEKVFKRVRRIPHETHMFAHHKGGSPYCELYFPATSDGPSTTAGLSAPRGQTFEQFIRDIDADLRNLLIAAQIIPERGIDERVLRLIAALVAKEARNLPPSFKAVEASGNTVLGNSTENAQAEIIAPLIFEFYTRDGARFIDTLFAQWALYCISFIDEKTDISVVLDSLIRQQKMFSDLAGTMLAGLALYYSGEDLSLFAEELIDIIGYVGDYKDDKRNGQGTHTWPDGEKYVGEFRDGKCNGQGTNTWPDGDKYVGEFRDGKCNGQGTYTWPDGQKYVGEFKDGKRNGQGTMTLPSGDKYVGEFKDDEFNGRGTSTWPNGQKYVGDHKDGKRNGQGTHTWADGHKYVGEFRDKFNGQGTFTRPDGSVYHSGLWADGKPVR